MDDYSEWKQTEFENSNEFKLLYSKLIHLENTNKTNEKEKVMKQILKLKTES